MHWKMKRLHGSEMCVRQMPARGHRVMVTSGTAGRHGQAPAGGARGSNSSKRHIKPLMTGRARYLTTTMLAVAGKLGTPTDNIVGILLQKTFYEIIGALILNKHL